MKTAKTYQPAVYAADTETTSEADYQIDGFTRVYLFHIKRVKGLDPSLFCKKEMDCKPDECTGTSMAEFFDWIESRTNDTSYVWWMNLSFDGAFIADYGLRNGYTFESYEDVTARNKGKKEACAKYLTEKDLPFYGEDGNKTYIPRSVTKAYDTPRKSMTVIKSGSSWIMLIIVNSKGHVIKLYDIGNKFTQAHGLEEIAELLGRPGKTELHVEKRRGPDYMPGEEEITRVKRDVDITADGIKLFYDWGMTCSTLAGDAWREYMSMCKEYYSAQALEILSKKDGWNDITPDIQAAMVAEMGKRLLGEIYPDKMPEKFQCADGVWIDIREAYQGGVVYVNPEYAEQDIEGVNVGDRNSMHPASMKFCEMPYGIPWCSIDEPQSSRYLVKFTTPFKIKKGKFPTIQMKGSIRTMDAEWIYDTHGEPVTLTMTDCDLKWFLDAYEIPLGFECLEKHYLNFRHKRLPVLGMYVDKWTAEKKRCKGPREAAKKAGDMVEFTKWNLMYYRAKIMQNSLYGKFGQNPVKPYQWGTLDEKNKLKIEESDVDAGEYIPPYATKYLAVACFITAESRNNLRETIEKIRD